MNKLSTISFRLLPLVVMLMAAVALGDSDSAFAARRSGGGGGKDTGGSAVLKVTPDPVDAGAWYVIEGSGFKANTAVYLSYHEPFCCGSQQVTADSSGQIRFSRQSGSTGTYTIYAYQYEGRKMALKGSVSFVVQ